jgi:hypothetical protein
MELLLRETEERLNLSETPTNAGSAERYKTSTQYFLFAAPPEA